MAASGRIKACHRGLERLGDLIEELLPGRPGQPERSLPGVASLTAAKVHGNGGRPGRRRPWVAAVAAGLEQRARRRAWGSGRGGRVRLMRMVAVVLGGGVGQRLGAGMPKQLLTLGGKTLVERCVAAFDQAPGIDEILVVMARGYTGQVKAMLTDAGYRKVAAVIEGGATRPDSTRVALAAIAAGHPGATASTGAGTAPGDCGVLLHDAARPLVDQRIIADCVAALRTMTRPGWRCPRPTPWWSPTTA